MRRLAVVMALAVLASFTGAAFASDCIGGWRKVTRRLDVLLSTRRGHVVQIEFGDPDALLICF